MINKVAIAFFLTAATANDALLTPKVREEVVVAEVVEEVPVEEEVDIALNWGIGIAGFVVGGLVESGANLGAVEPCVG